MNPSVDRQAVDSAERAGFGGRLPHGRRPALLVVDLIRAFTSPAHQLGSNLDDVVASTRALLERARKLGLPRIFTTIAFQPDLADAGLWPVKVPALRSLLRGSAEVEVDPRLAPGPGEAVLVKQGASAMFGTNLGTLLAFQRVDSVIVCGATTSGCVRATGVDLLQAGYPVLIPADCVGDRDLLAHEASLRDLDGRYCDVIGQDAALLALETGRREEVDHV